MHLSYIREKTGHALAGFRQWVPEEQVKDAAACVRMALPLDLEFLTKGRLAIEILKEARADGLIFDYICGDEVYGNCTKLREYLEEEKQAYVLRVPKNFTLTFSDGKSLACEDAVKKMVRARNWETRSAGKGSKGERWYAWAWIRVGERHSRRSAGTCNPVTWPFTTATCLRAGCARWRPSSGRRA